MAILIVYLTIIFIVNSSYIIKMKKSIIIPTLDPLQPKIDYSLTEEKRSKDQKE